VADKYGLDITVRKIKSLLDTEWLNSEVVTFWLEWWCEQIGAGSEKRMPKSSSKPKCWVANTYFYSELTKDGVYCYNLSKDGHTGLHFIWFGSTLYAVCFKLHLAVLLDWILMPLSLICVLPSDSPFVYRTGSSV
jgi:hypothetical protein